MPSRTFLAALTWLLVVFALNLAVQARSPDSPIEPIRWANLPKEAQTTLRLIKAGGPFPYPRDGVVFHNRERILPIRARSFYREYTVPTPGARNRGAQRIVVGGGTEFYYTPDHYRSFRRIIE